jgi:hypothetical protein
MHKPWRRNVAITALASIILTACAGLEKSFGVLTFQKDERSGIVAGQQFRTIFYRSDSFKNMSDEIDGPVRRLFSEELVKVMDFYCKSLKVPPKDEFGIRLIDPGTIAAKLFTAVAGYTFNAVKEGISARGEQIARASQKSYAARYVSSDGAARWSKVKCLLLVRETGTSEKTDEIGLELLMVRKSFGRASTLRPVYVSMKNAVAWTQKESGKKKPIIKLGVGLVMHSAVFDKKLQRTVVVETAKIAMPVKKVAIGKSRSLCGNIADDRRACGLDSDLIPNPPAKAPLSIALQVAETGTSANAKQHAEAANKALDSIAKPAFDEFVKQIAAGISG